MEKKEEKQSKYIVFSLILKELAGFFGRVIFKRKFLRNEIKNKDGALLFDAYREQEKLMVKYRGASNIEGLQNVLYICPHCGKEFTVRVKNKSTLYCTECGFAHTSDAYGFLHNTGGVGDEIRYVSDWSRTVYERTSTAV